jgi:hypothetical protein
MVMKLKLLLLVLKLPSPLWDKLILEQGWTTLDKVLDIITIKPGRLKNGWNQQSASGQDGINNLLQDRREMERGWKAVSLLI